MGFVPKSFLFHSTLNYSLKERFDDPDSIKEHIDLSRAKIHEIEDVNLRFEEQIRIAVFARNLEDYFLSLDLIEDAMEWIKKEKGSDKKIFQCIVELFLNHLEMGGLEEAATVFSDLVERGGGENESEPFYQAYLAYCLGRLVFEKRQYQASIEFFKMAASLASSARVHDIEFKSLASIELLKANFLGEEFDLDGLNQGLQEIRSEQNQAPVEDFLGLNPEQMYSILAQDFTENNLLFDMVVGDDDLLSGMPLVQQVLFLMDEIHRHQTIKLTQKGNLPKIIVESFYQLFYSDKKKRVPNNEDEIPELTRIKYLLGASGFSRKVKGKVSLTVKGKKVLEGRSLKVIFDMVKTPLFNKWNWDFTDGLHPCPRIQQTAIFNYYLVHKLAQNWISSQELGEAYIRAFPHVISEIKSYYRTPEREFLLCFKLRFLDQMGSILGVLEQKKENKKSLYPKEYYRVNDRFRQMFQFHKL